MLSKNECLRYAEQCEGMAKIARAEENRAVLSEMAKRWRDLAQTAKETAPLQ